MVSKTEIIATSVEMAGICSVVTIVQSLFIWHAWRLKKRSSPTGNGSAPSASKISCVNRAFRELRQKKKGKEEERKKKLDLKQKLIEEKQKTKELKERLKEKKKHELIENKMRELEELKKRNRERLEANGATPIGHLSLLNPSEGINDENVG